MEKNKKVTISEIAQLAGTSKTTISFYLNNRFDKMSEATKKRIDQAISDTGYTPSYAARSLNSKKMKLIGVLIGDITNNFANQIVKGIDNEAKTKGYQLIMANSNYNLEDEKKHIDNMLAMGVDGFIIQPTRQFEELIPKIKNSNKDLVFIDSNLNNDEISVKANTYQACYDIAHDIKLKGYDEILIISAEPSLLSTRLERVNGLTDGCISQDLSYTIHIVDETTKSKTITDIMTANMSLNKKYCVAAMNCWLLPKVFLALHDFKNLIPQNIGLFGFDNTEWSNFSSPTITSIIQPAYEEGQVACKLLIDMIEETNTTMTNTTIIDCEINWNESTDRK